MQDHERGEAGGQRLTQFIHHPGEARTGSPHNAAQQPTDGCQRQSDKRCTGRGAGEIPAHGTGLLDRYDGGQPASLNDQFDKRAGKPIRCLLLRASPGSTGAGWRELPSPAESQDAVGAAARIPSPPLPRQIPKGRSSSGAWRLVSLREYLKMLKAHQVSQGGAMKGDDHPSLLTLSEYLTRMQWSCTQWQAALPMPRMWTLEPRTPGSLWAFLPHRK